jgi:hypothetical protein
MIAHNALISFFTLPLNTPIAAAPEWSVQVTSATTRPVTVLVYGREAGLHIVRAPASNSTEQARVIPARLAQGRLYLMSLGSSALRVQSYSPRGAQPMSFQAQSHAVTAIQDRNGIRVSTGW